MIHSTEAVERARATIAAAVKAAEITTRTTPHVGRANVKTHAINEGTSPLITCSAAACSICGRECYAVFYVDVLYPAARINHAENTIIRRRDPRAYYLTFFSTAQADGARLVRVNETGDFENAAQVRALFEVARKYSQIAVLGYTRRPELAGMLNGAPANVHIRYSVYRDGDPNGDAVRRSRCAAVSDTITTCPAQVRADINKRRAAAGLEPLPAWTCAACAAAGVGCASEKAVVIFRAH